MTDRELLELAAKAAGIKSTGWSGKGNHWYEGISFNDENDCLQCWNPLTDDGDALRLAVKLTIDISQFGSGAVVVYASPYVYQSLARIDSERLRAYEPYHPDPLTATRRAIVRLAAEIGKTL